jgi:hypothetical protein
MTEVNAARRAGEAPASSWVQRMCGTPLDWQPYIQFTYRKRHCDVRLRDGSEVGPCWPNAGVFHDLNGSGRQISQADVTYVRYYDRNREAPCAT